MSEQEVIVGNFQAIRNVRRRIQDGKTCYLVEMEEYIVAEGVWDTVEHYAVPGAGGNCDRVIAAINRGEYEGEITDWQPPGLTWANIRTKRDRLLRDSDIEVLPDRWAAMSEAEQQAWTAYRQALRDIPQDYESPQDVVWPQVPGSQ